MPPLDPSIIEATFLANLLEIDRIARKLCRRYGFSTADADDFIGSLRLKFIQNDYAVLRAFTGRGELRMYLIAVATTHMIDVFIAERGKWRPSAAAQREGAVAIHLERLVHRDGVSLREACEQLRSRGITTMRDGELRRLFARLPVRPPLRPIAESIDADDVALIPDDATPDPIDEEERRASERLLERALEKLPMEDRVIIRMRYWEGLTAGEIARMLALKERSVFARLERMITRLRRGLESRDLR